MDKNNDGSIREPAPEVVNEIFHLESRYQQLWDIFVEHPVYKIKGCGYLHYQGEGVWIVDGIEFPANAVKLLFRSTRKIYLR